MQQLNNLACELNLKPPANIYLIGICGTGMGNLAGLLKTRGFRVTGSDARAYPPMSDELAARGIDIHEGYRASNLREMPDLVVVGNVCRKDHVEVIEAVRLGLPMVSMPGALAELFLNRQDALVIAGTHGKTTTTALLSFLLRATGQDPSFLVGGIADDFGTGHHLGGGRFFVIEGDEYDSAFFEKRPKFLSYRPKGAVLTSVEHDHIDIYSTWDDYRGAFERFAALLPPQGILAVYAGDAAALEVAEQSRAHVVRYAVEGDPTPVDASWIAVPVANDKFELKVDGDRQGEFQMPLEGRHNLRNILAALILAHLQAGVALEQLRPQLPKFRGVRRRQQLLGEARGVKVFDDFAHHPTAVRETLLGMAPKARAGGGRLVVAFEPRSATACRKLHQEAYVEAFDGADLVVIAPVGRPLPEGERLDIEQLASQVTGRGVKAHAAGTLDHVRELLLEATKPGDTIVLLSNGDFGGLREALVKEV